MHHEFTNIAGWQKTSLIDFPNKVATVLFFRGCNLRCPYCHNPSLVNFQSVNNINPEEVWAFLQKRKNMIDAVVLSGGEPTLQQEIVSVVKKIRDLGYSIKLDTNGLLPDVIEAIAPDYLALDIKTLPRFYETYLGATSKNIVQQLVRSIDIVRKMKSQAEIRITCAPGIIDKSIIVEMSEMLMGIETVYLQPMQNRVLLLDKQFAEKELLSREEIENYKEILGTVVGTCIMRGEQEK